MSKGFFFVSENKLDKSFFDYLHAQHYSGDEITEYVLNKKEGIYYYHIDPVIIYQTDPQHRVDIDDREMGPAEYLRFFASKLYKKKGFNFLYCDLNDEEIAIFDFELYIKKHTKEDIEIEDFNRRALDPQHLFKIGIIYLLKP